MEYSYKHFTFDGPFWYGTLFHSTLGYTKVRAPLSVFPHWQGVVICDASAPHHMIFFDVGRYSIASWVIPRLARRLFQSFSIGRELVVLNYDIICDTPILQHMIFFDPHRLPHIISYNCVWSKWRHPLSLLDEKPRGCVFEPLKARLEKINVQLNSC